MIKRRKFLGKLVVGCLFLMLSFVASFHAEVASEHPNYIEASRSLLPTEKSKSLSPSQELSSKQLMEAGSGYCSSVGGSTLYESISKVTVNRVSANVVQIVVDVYIANPTGCTSGNPCPEYDQSPEYVNVWIDWDGDKVFESNEKVLDESMTGYLNINYNGTMTATSQVTIPDGAKSSTYLRANLGWGYDPNDPCEYSWTWGNVIDQPLEIITAKVLQLDALNDVPIRDITNPIWQKTFDPDGNLIDVSPVQNDPIADDMTSGSFSIKATLGAHPSQPSWTPEVSYQWFIQGYSGYSGNGQFTGWNGTFNVFTPQSVDHYALNLTFTIYDNKGNIITQNQSMNIKLYAVYDTPIISLPKEKWIDKATTWGQYAVGPWSASIFLNNDIYSKGGWLYRDGATSWQALIEGTATQGNCVSFSNVWNSLSKVLGVAGTSVQQTTGQYNSGFLTKPATSLPPENLSGNAHPQSGSFDRWLFGMHQVGKFGSSYFDPTFGKEYHGSIFDFIEWHATGNAGSDSFGNYLELTSGHKAYFISGKTPTKPWGEWVYHSPVSNMPDFSENGTTFTGNYTTYGVDSDGTGFYNALNITAEINVATLGDYSALGVLRWGTEKITMRPSYNSMGFSSASIQVTQTGLTSISLPFSGEDIYNSGFDGVYTVDLTLYDSNGQPIASNSFDTPNHNHTEFKEVPVSLENSSDFGEDINSNGFFDFLTADVIVNVIKSGRYDISGYLASGTSIIVGAGTSEVLAPGNNTVTLKFDGRKIRNSGINGPYQLHVSLSDGITSVERDFNTKSYSYTQFESGLINITDSFSDYGTDSDGDGYYNFLTLELDINVIQAGNYKVIGWLNDSAGDFIDHAHSEELFGTGTQTVILNFDGRKIYEHGVGGPYVLNYFVVYDENNNPVDNTPHDVYTTAAYNYTNFQSPLSPLVSLTDNYTDTGVDTDGDGDFDLLRIQVEVITSAKGNVIANGRVVDNSGDEIQWASGVVYVEADIPQMISIDFDGRLIYANKKNGPYFIKNLNVYHAGDPSQNVYRDEAYTTGAYVYTDFDITEIIYGSVTDKGNPVRGALVSVSGVGFDYTNSKGNYHIAVMNPGTYTTTIAAEGYTSWEIFVSGTHVGEGTSTEVSVAEEEAIQVNFKQQCPVPVDIKPQSCPNPLNTNAMGVFPVAILGTIDFNVTEIDPDSVLLEGVAPLRYAEEDVVTPFEPFIGKKEAYDCTIEGADGHLDLTLKFRTQDIVAILGAVSDGEVRVLELTGNLKEEYGGTPFVGGDVVVILKKK